MQSGTSPKALVSICMLILQPLNEASNSNEPEPYHQQQAKKINE